MNDYHIPVLLTEVISSLNIKKNAKYIDCTLGGGGHTEKILEKGGCVLAIDCDADAISYTKERLSSFLDTACPDCRSEKTPESSISQNKTGALFAPPAGGLILVKDNFANLKSIVAKNAFFPVSGILFDLGVSSYQLETPDRGFSFNTNAILDMRMDQNLTVKAMDLVNGLTEKEIYELFSKLGEEHLSWAIAHALVRTRQIKKITTCDELAKLILKVRGKRGKFDRTHPATRIFQALRIAVNDELNNLRAVLPQTLEILEKKGRLVVISFHSLEDRIVKNFFKSEAEKGTLKIITKHPTSPSEEEIKINPRSRSAKLRIGEKI